MSKVFATRRWAIEVDDGRFIGPGWWFGDGPPPGILFEAGVGVRFFLTRRDAREGLKTGRVRQSFPGARVVPVRVTVEVAR